MLRELPSGWHPELLVGFETRDDAGVFRVKEGFALVQTVDFFTPIVDDAYLYGAIAAANALSDIYAMGGRPLTVLNIVGYPPDKMPPEMLVQILRGGYEKVQEAGAVVVGGHTLESSEPLYGLAVTGWIDPERVVTIAGAQPGDLLVLTKPLGTGILTTAAKFDECPPESLKEACRVMSTLNAGAAEAMQAVGVHAATDITGFGLLGHLHQMALASGVCLEIWSEAVPLLPSAEPLAEAGNTTRGGKQNLEYLAEFLQLPASLSPARLQVLLDPQTSGGLAIGLPEAKVESLLQKLQEKKAPCARVIGRVVPGKAGGLIIRTN